MLKADFQRRMDRLDAARLSYQRAIDLSDNESEKAFLRNRMASVGARS